MSVDYDVTEDEDEILDYFDYLDFMEEEENCSRLHTDDDIIPRMIRFASLRNSMRPLGTDYEETVKRKQQNLKLFVARAEKGLDIWTGEQIV